MSSRSDGHPECLSTVRAGSVAVMIHVSARPGPLLPRLVVVECWCFPLRGLLSGTVYTSVSSPAPALLSGTPSRWITDLFHPASAASSTAHAQASCGVKNNDRCACRVSGRAWTLHAPRLL